MKKAIGDNMIPKGWGFEKGLELVKNAGFDGIELWLAGLSPVALELVRRAPLGQTLGRERMCFDVAQALSRFQSGTAKAAAQ